jgi:hypothetical protein
LNHCPPPVIGVPPCHAGKSETEMTLPDRLSIDERSPFYNAEALERGVGILFNGKERTDVSEYCVSEGWIRVPAGNSKDRFGNPMTIKLKGEVKPFVPEEPAA